MDLWNKKYDMEEMFQVYYAKVLLYKQKLDALNFALQNDEGYRSNPNQYLDSARDVLYGYIHEKLTTAYSNMFMMSMSNLISDESKKIAKQLAYEQFKCHEEIRTRYNESGGRYPFNGWTKEEELEYQQNVKKDYIVMKLKMDNGEKFEKCEIQKMNHRINCANLQDELTKLREDQ